ncbi:ParB/RepB/Spo0J family partition protein (plasmid) [Sphingomonas carotinifaciens]|uniref:ParB/RepB/Spo0J family partition protein n=1 Tax=Sphingomonas carotinifaciens TaxID=1166323 RepID=UPI0039A2823A
MARKQSDYLAALLAEDEAVANVEPPPAPPDRNVERARGTTLLGRESALARVASGEVRQVTQLLLDPARVRIWPGNARSYAHLSEENCRELIDSLIAEGGQKVPAVVRRIDGDPEHEYEVIAGTRRHWSVRWLRANSYPDMQFVAQVANLDDEAAFRLADIENRARKDVSDLERARNYAEALRTHYGNHQTRMAERLKLSKGWLSKMLKVATIPDGVVAAFASPADIQLKPAYALAQLLDTHRSQVTGVAKRLVEEQADRHRRGLSPYAAAEVMRRLMEAPSLGTVTEPVERYRYTNAYGRTILSLQSENRQGVTIRLHAGSGADTETVVDAVRNLLDHLERSGRGIYQ